MDNKVKVTVEYERGGELVKEVVESDFVICMADSEYNGKPAFQTMILGKTNPLNLIMAAAQLQNNVKEAVMGGFLKESKAHEDIRKVSDGLRDILNELMEVLNNGKYQN